ncbi:cytoplasmic dynein 2 heavy chain 1 [Amyelois transitella]|uniref:cytoplasmic dynein 2 heavy chain 1 n=1 Tax=Amyelois transitella TaxID=680683 RepID=UPI00298FE0EE|nr:cytoplasmic dynein 2 heavy chain 1 [Amyelois transitella]
MIKMSPLKNFILFTSENYFSLSNVTVDENSEQALSDFIHNSQTLLLQGRINGNSVIFNNKICNDNNQSIIFYKTSAQDLNGDDGAKILNIATISTNVAESLYQSLKHVYTPLFAHDDLYSNKLQKNLHELESHLRVLLHGKGEGNMNVILTIEDEVEYWKTLKQKQDSNSKEKEAAATMCEIFEDICDEIRSLQSNSMSEIREIVENIGGLLDDVWRFTIIPYSHERMIHIFDAIGHVINTNIQKACLNLKLWEVNNVNIENSVLQLLSESLAAIQTWISACESLTGTYWPNYALHAWNGKPYVPSFSITFQTRLKEIFEIRSTYCQLNKLLTNAEKTDLKTHQLFVPFENINVWAYNGPNNVWETAVSRFSIALRPAETKIAEKLRPRLHNTSTKQMLYEFIRYKSLIERPLVKQALNTELDIFVSSLISLVKSIQSQLECDEMDVRMYQPPEMSPLVQQVQWAKQMEAKVKDIQTCAEQHLKEYESSVELSKLSARLLKDLKAMYIQLHEEWSREIQAQAKSGSLQLSMDKPVVEFSPESRLMVVNFNPRLSWWALEARTLAALGLPPPPAAAALDTLNEARVHARALLQVASFHNTLGERMIPSTRPMMLQAALDLSALVQDQKAVYWDDLEQIANYTNKLKEQVLKLESQNSYLTSQHLAIRKIVEELMDTELLAQQSEWKKHIKDIRDIIEKVEANGYTNTDAWRTHWDGQIYKALECQYIKTLLSLHKHFPHVKVDLVLRGQQVRVQPPLEEVRVQHYQQLRRLAALPAAAAPLQRRLAGSALFADIVQEHGWLANVAVQQLEAAMRSLQQTCDAWTRRAALACVPDLSALCAERLAEPQHWELNFKACKAYGQAVAKMNFEDEKIEWISVGTASLRRELESSSRELWAALMSSLQTSCRGDALKLDEFVAAASLLLRDKQMPKNAKELAELSAQQQALQANIPDIEKTVECIKRKAHMLRTWGGDASIDGSIHEWNKTRELMISQQQMFEHQAEIVKTGLSGEWENLNSSVEAWTSRWEQNKPRLSDTRDVQYEEMSQRCRSVFEARGHWEQLLAEKEQLTIQCEKFNMNIEPSNVWQDAEKLMNEYVTMWMPLKEYIEEYESISGQEWIVFQKKLHLLEEFASKWGARLEPYTAVTLYMRQELDKFADLTPLLKYVRGADFTEFHWREVFGLLGLEYKKPDTVVLRDWLEVAVNIKKQVKALQKICTNASSEAAIRSALNDLELWFAGARVSITYYTDHAKRPTPIVKDFKDLLAKIEEQQWIVSSVSAGGAGAAGAWEGRLRSARALAAAAHHAQRRWLYLEPILCSDEGDLGTKFRKVDQGFRQVARIFEADPRLSALLQSSRLQSMLDSISEQLVSCQSALNQYIDEKRSVFPRLYFLSDDDLLELLGQARAGAEGREVVMQTHLKKLFPGTTGVRLGPGGMSITALCTHFDETFQLDHPVDIDCPVEVWLKNLEIEMRSSLRNVTLKCVLTNSLQDQDPFSLPTQILCLTQNIHFTEQAEKAIASKDLHKLKANVEKENSYYASAEADDESERHKRQALILQCTYYISVICTLIENNVVSTSDWLWQKQLRFYLLGNKEVIAKMGLAEISYSYEYLGINTGQFVRTELADECFLILTQSLHLGLVGNPFGPAGTGKTESVKALGGLVGRLVLVFNCDEAMDAECMGRLLSGLALCGAWGCFDEFNRLDADTLAAVAHQLGSLLPAMQRSAARQPAVATLNGKQIEVNPWCGVAATMNPAGRGYGGRRQLPAALQRALRPVAMTAPAPRPLASSLLAARALPKAEHLASLLCDVFSLASELLSGQRHYDWGLRALKAAVSSCGAALAAAQAGQRAAPATLLRRLLALNKLSELSQRDADRFEDILTLVFGDPNKEETTDDPLKKVLEESVETLGYTHNAIQIQKCMQLYEQLQQRMGVAIVGPPGSGKTTIRQLLKTALTQQGRTIVEYVIGPKSMSRENLLGHIDRDTRQWADGVISATALEISNQGAAVWSWVVLDGDVDPEWVEALNSVLDDNRLLTLPSGARLHLTTGVNFLFETHELKHASPATISRLGIVLLSNKTCCAEEALESLLRGNEFDDEPVKMAVPLLQQVVKKCLHWFNSHRSDFMLKISNTNMVKQILTQFKYAAQNAPSPVTPEKIVKLAVQRSVVGILKAKAVDAFYDQACSDIGGAIGMSVMNTGSLTSEASWHGSLLLSPRLAASEPALRAALAGGQHLLVIGPHACGKNLLIEHALKETDSTVITITCTPVTEPADVIAELKRHNVVRAGRGARCVLALRALQRARRDRWGCSPLLQFLLQLIQCGGFWSVGGAESGAAWSGAAVRLLASATVAPPDARLAALPTLILPEPDDDELTELARNSLSNNIDKNIAESEISNLVPKIVAMFKEVTETFYSRPHYKWNASHLIKWCENVKWYSPSNVADLSMALTAEANSIFRDRLVTEEERASFANICRIYMKDDKKILYFTPKQRDNSIYLEEIGRDEWNQRTQKLINQCLTENELAFDGVGAEVCLELSVLCTAMARATCGGVVTCVGSAGTGRRAAATLLGAALPAQLFFIESTQHFNLNLKNAVTVASEGSRSLVVLSESAVECALLSHIEALRSAASPLALPDILPSVTSSALEQIKQYLGFVICLDKNQENLWDLMKKFPWLYSEDVVWIESWCSETVQEMPRLIVNRLVKEDVSQDKEQSDPIPVDGFVSIYNSIELEPMRAPIKYVRFVKTYYHILSKKRQALLQRHTMLSAGVEALRRARVSVGTLQEEAAAQKAALAERQAAAAAALDQITATVRHDSAKKDDMNALKATIERENNNLQIRKKEIEAELASVEPVIEAARSAVGDIRPESLSEVRSLRAPPDVVRDILEGVLRLMGIADTSWHSMKNFLSKRGVKEDIRCLDASQIKPEAAAAVSKLLERRGASFEPSAAKRASAACAPLAAWVRANLAYAEALARVQPLQQQQRQLLQNLKDAESQLAALSTGLESVTERVSALKEQLGRETREAAAIELRLETATATITAARGLLDRLADEDTAWARDLEHISKEITELNLRSLLAAGYLVYLPHLTEPQARDYIKKWSSLIGFDDTSFSVINFLSTVEMQLKWEADGLPADETAIKNAVVITQALEQPSCGLTPLLVDPDGDALAWLQRTLGSNGEIVSQDAHNIHTAVQYALRLNRPLVVQSVRSAHAAWSPALLSGARLVLQCEQPPVLPPSLMAHISTVNFAARLDPLTDLLVHHALQQQNPEVNEKSKELKIQKATLQKQQHELQENLLRELSTKSDILHDVNLLESLNQTRATAATIREALQEAAELERASSAAAARYTASAARCATLALAVRRLARARPLLALPMQPVRAHYTAALRHAQSKDSQDINSEEVVKYFTKRIIERVLLALHKKEKYTVVLYLLKEVYEEDFPEKLWQLFLGNTTVTDDQDIRSIVKSFSWIPDECAKNVAQIKVTSEDLFNKLHLEDKTMWERFLESGELSLLARLGLSPLESVLAVSALRPDSRYRAIVALVEHYLGGVVLRSRDALSLAARAARGRRVVLALGAVAADTIPLTLCVGISEGRAAWWAGVESCRRGGALGVLAGASPLCLELQQFVLEVLAAPPEDFSEDFRLWIISEDREVPAALSNACINVILEAPEGVKPNVLSTLSAWGEYSAEPELVRMHACLALFHALAQERRAYIPQGLCASIRRAARHGYSAVAGLAGQLPPRLGEKRR